MPTSFPFLNWGSLHPTWVAVLIFGLRAADVTLATLRMLAVVRGRRASAWLIGFAEAVLFVTVISGLLSSLAGVQNLLAFAAGYATGNVAGIALEGRIAPGFSLLRITTSGRGEALARALRQAGHGATEALGRGQAGTVSLIYCYVPRREVDRAKRLAVGADPQAFITVEHVRRLGGGWLP